MLCFYFWLSLQILLESFPVSSSGHCLLLEQYLSKLAIQINHYEDFLLHNEIVSSMRVALLDHFVHGTTVVVIALFFFSRWSWLLLHLRSCWRIIAKIIVLTAIADIITIIFYLIFGVYTFNFPVPVGFIITAILLLSLIWAPKKNNGVFDWRAACMLGIAQGFALLPGISRFAATYVIARWLCLSPHKAFENSWLVAWPLIAVAFLHSAGIIIITTPESLLLRPATIIIMMTAGVLSFYALRFVATLAYDNKMWWFGLYMIIPIIISLVFVG